MFALRSARAGLPSRQLKKTPVRSNQFGVPLFRVLRGLRHPWRVFRSASSRCDSASFAWAMPAVYLEVGLAFRPRCLLLRAICESSRRARQSWLARRQSQSIDYLIAKSWVKTLAARVDHQLNSTRREALTEVQAQMQGHRYNSPATDRPLLARRAGAFVQHHGRAGDEPAMSMQFRFVVAPWPLISTRYRGSDRERSSIAGRSRPSTATSS